MIFSIALQNLLASRKRSAFLGIALGLVTMLLVLLSSLTNGIQDNLIRTATLVSTGHVNVGGFFKTTPGDAQPLVTRTPALEAVVREVLPDAVRITDRARGWGKIVSDRGTIQVGITGIEPDKEKELLSLLTLATEGEYRVKTDTPERTKGSFDDIRKPNAVIIFASQAKQLEGDVGDQLTIRTETFTGQSNTADVTIVAIARDLGPLSTWSSFVPKQVTTSLYQWKPDVSGAVQVYLKDIEDSEEAMGKLRAAFEKKGFGIMDHESQPFFMKFQTIMGEDWLGQKLDITTWRDESSFLLYVVTAIQSVSFLLISMLTIIIVIGIMNSTYIAVRERTKEIGTLRAIGLSRGGVLQLFLIESLLLGLAATLIGAIAGASLATALSAAELRFDAEALRAVILSDTLNLKASVADVVTAVVTFTVITGLSALLPALRASRVPPVVAMQAAE